MARKIDADNKLHFIGKKERIRANKSTLKPRFIEWVSFLALSSLISGK